jgi:hypothetical protein
MNQRTALSRFCIVSLSLAAAAGAIAGNLPAAALAQNTLPPATAPLGVPEAPVGHRQPKPSDLPPAVQREEQSNAPVVQDNAQARRNRDDGGLGQLPTICVRC